MGGFSLTKKIFKYSSTAATAVLVATAITGVVSAAENTYSDVPTTHVFFEEIEALTKAKVVDGVGNNNFNPEGIVTRGQMAKMIVKAFGLEGTPTTSFSDVPANHDFKDEIGILSALNIAQGYGDGTFKPNQQVSRQEIALFISRALQLTSTKEIPFEDVENYGKSIVALYEKQIIKGTSATTFAPNKKATRGEAAAMVARAMKFEENRPFTLDVAHVNDVHAYVQNYPKLITAVKEQRQYKRDSLVLHAGDVFSGTLYFNVFEGEADQKLLNLVNFDAMVFGNHEFDLGSSPAGHQALRDFITGSNFPFIGANVDFSKDEKLNDLQTRTITATPENGKVYDAIIKEVKGEKIGIFGLTTEETAGISSANDVEFENYIERAKATVAALEAQGVNKIIALTHIGYDDNPQVDNDIELAKAVDGIDLIVGGHSHTKLEKPVAITEDANGNAKDLTIITQAYQYVDFLGTVTVEFDDNGVISNFDGELITLSNYKEDAKAVELLAPYKKGIADYEKQEIGVATEIELPSPRLNDPSPVSVRSNETILGNLITDGMLKTARETAPNKSIVLAVQNGGGIRATIPAGNITVGQVKSVLPFANTLAIVDLTGAEIKAMFEHALKEYPKEHGGFLHVAGGKVTFDSSKPAGERVVSIQYLNETGEYVDIPADNTMYTIASNAFTIKGGDSFSMLEAAYHEGRMTDFGSVDSDNFEKFLKSLGTITAENAKIEGRIVDVNTQE